MDVKTEVGLCAGEVYNYLSGRGQVPVIDVVNNVKHDHMIVIAALGWLLREDKINATAAGKRVLVSLKQ